MTLGDFAFWSKTRTVKCPDGTTRFVYKDPNDAFPIFLKNVKAHVSGAADILKKVKGKVDASVDVRISQLLVELDSKNRSLHSHFRAVYLTYAASPCTSHEYLQAEVRDIRADEHSLRIAEVMIQQTSLFISNEHAATAAQRADVINRCIEQTFALLNRSSAAMALERQMARVAEKTKAWRQ